MNNNQVAINWRSQIKDSGRSQNMFYEHDVIYSYGYHFPMAFLTNKMHNGKTIVVQNSYGYSNSTAGHLNHMRSQCYDDAVITIGTPLLKKLISFNPDIEAIKKEAQAEIKERMILQEGKKATARTERMRDFWQSDIDENIKQLEYLESL